MEKEENRLIYLDVLRIFAMFSVMLLHVASRYWYRTPIDSNYWMVFNIYDSLARFCVPAFIMISGAFLLNPDKKYTIKDIYTRKLSRILTALFFWSFLYAFHGTFIQKILRGEVINGSVFIDFINSFLVGHFHLGFIYLLAGLYLVAPFLRKFTNDKKLMKLFIILSFIFGSIVEILGLIPYLNITLNLVMDNLEMFFVLGYTGYFVAGYYLLKYDLAKGIKLLIYILALISILFTIIGTYFMSLNNGKVSEVLFSYTVPNTVFTTIAIFIFFKDVVSKIRFSEKSIKIILLFSRLSFGMYLIHDFVNIAFRYLEIKTINYNPIVSVPIMAIIVFIVSFMLIWILNKIPLLRKYIM